MELGARMAAWRKHKGLTQLQVAQACDPPVTVAAVSYWESNDTSPSQAHLRDFVKLLGITMERFYGRVPRSRAA